MRTERSRIGKVPVIASSLSLTGCRMRAVVLGHGLQGARFESHDAVASYSGDGRISLRPAPVSPLPPSQHGQAPDRYRPHLSKLQRGFDLSGAKRRTPRHAKALRGGKLGWALRQPQRLRPMATPTRLKSYPLPRCRKPTSSSSYGLAAVPTLPTRLQCEGRPDHSERPTTFSSAAY